MIVKMKKLTLFCTPTRQEKTLQALHDLKVLHVKHVKEPGGSAVDGARRHLQHVQRAKEVLDARSGSVSSGVSDEDFVDAVWTCIEREKALREQQQNLEREIARVKPFGDFDPLKIEALREAGLNVRLYEFPSKGALAAPEGVALHEIGRSKGTIYVLSVAQRGFTLPALEVELPKKGLLALQKDLEATQTELAENEAELQRLADDRAVAEKLTHHAFDELTHLEVRHGMGRDEAVAYLQGYYPAEREEEIATTAKEQGWGFRFDEIGKDDDPPTLLRNPKWINLIQPVFSMIKALPGYKEIDISFLFLLFLSIFFGFVIGDAGYGVLFIILSFIVRCKMGNRKKAKQVTSLVMVMSTAAVVWGMLSGIYFGIDYDLLPGALKKASSSWLMAGGDGDLARSRVMFICFTIGAIHLSIAHVWGFVRKINSAACLCDLGWLCSTWALYFLVLHLILGWVELGPAIGIALAAGVVLVALGLILLKSWEGLVTLGMDVLNNFVDLISYVRLYAVGTATFAIAHTFNQMGWGAGSAMHPSLGVPSALMILGIGHTINILLVAMGVLVHGLRLNILEFSGHAEVQWGGSAYQPFGKTSWQD